MDEKIAAARQKREEQRKKTHSELMLKMTRAKEQYQQGLKDVLAKAHKENRK